MELFEKAKNFTTESGIAELINNSDAVLIAYSGGADSSVLLHFLFQYLKGTKIKLAAAHLNHMIRGKEADRDQSFCKKTTEELNIPFYTKNIDIPKIAAENGKTLEEAARDERYSFLSDIAQILGENTLIATAHNSTDNLETVIFNLARGSGTTGMGGIAPIRKNIIRPLLCVSGEEIRSYAKENNIQYVTDSTNADTAYTRNHIRKNIVPLLREINPSAEEAVLRLTKIARSEVDYIKSEAAKLSANGYVTRDDFCKAHPALRTRILHTLYTDFAGTPDGLSAAVLENAAEFASGATGKISLPHNITLFSDRDRIYIGTANEEKCCEKTLLSLILNAPAVPFGENFAVALCEKGKEPIYDINIYNLFIKQSTSFDTIYGSLFVRCRREGDRILINKMHKKLKKLMCDKGIPLRFRESLPIFCDESGIIWAPKLALRDGAKGEDITMYVFTLKG